MSSLLMDCFVVQFLKTFCDIQECYNITAAEFIEKLGAHMHELTALELFQMGYLWNELGDHLHAREWFLEAVKRFPKKTKFVGFLEKASLYGV